MKTHKEVITKAIYILREFWPDWKVTDNTVTAWAMVLDDYPVHVVEKALLQYMKNPKKTYTKIPRPDQVVEIIQQTLNNSWDEVFDEICSKAYRSLHPILNMGQWIEVEWSSPDVPVLMDRMGGAHYFTELETKNLGTARAQFRQIYENYTAKNGAIVDNNQVLLGENSRGLLGNG